MDKAFKIPPVSPHGIITPDDLVMSLKSLVGKSFEITGKPRTDGSSLRKMISRTLLNNGISPEAVKGSFEIVSPKNKGVPRLIRELIDSYIVTTGDSYNLQVWNRIPNSKSILIQYNTGEKIQSNDIRFVFVKIDMDAEIIESIVILTSDYIESNFGNFGKPTIKHQLMIPNKRREQIICSANPVFTCNDSYKLAQVTTNEYRRRQCVFNP